MNEYQNPRQLALGQRVRFIVGTFEQFEGTVQSIDREAGKAVVGISIFGIVTPVDVTFDEVEPID